MPEVSPSSRSLHRVSSLTWDWHLRWTVKLKEILMTSVWFVQFLTISVQINSLSSQTMSQSVNRWRCGVHTHPRRSLQVMCHPVVLTPQTRWVGPDTHIHHIQHSLSQRNLFCFDMLVVSEDLVSLWQVLSLTVHCGIGDVFNNKTGKLASATLPPSGQKSDFYWWKITPLQYFPYTQRSFFNCSWHWSNWRG